MDDSNVTDPHRVVIQYLSCYIRFITCRLDYPTIWNGKQTTLKKRRCRISSSSSTDISSSPYLFFIVFVLIEEIQQSSSSTSSSQRDTVRVSREIETEFTRIEDEVLEERQNSLKHSQRETERENERERGRENLNHLEVLK